MLFNGQKLDFKGLQGKALAAGKTDLLKARLEIERFSMIPKIYEVK
jgi:hypothetical protein